MTRRLFIAAFECERDIMGATRAAREAGYVIDDIYTPYAVHGLDKAMGLRPSRLSWICLAFAVLGAGGAIGFQYWASMVDWPINIGGKPWNSLPAFIPITFEMAVLLGGLGVVAALLWRCRLFPGKKPSVPDIRVTDNLFVLVLVQHDASFDPLEAAQLCGQHHAVHVEERVEGQIVPTPSPADKEGAA